MHPKEITITADGRGLHILWSNGQLSQISGGALRRVCDCAECRSNTRGELLSLAMLSSGANRIREIDLLSSSRLLVIWEDGHDKSIYQFPFLLENFPP